jgi:hypothetical protein
MTDPGSSVADVVIVGAGVVGTAIARTLARYFLDCVLIDAASDVGTGTSKANTAILHTGFDAKPGTLESRLQRRDRPDVRRGRVHDQAAAGRADRVRQAGQVAAAVDPAAGADRADQGGARRADGVRERAAGADRRGRHGPVRYRDDGFWAGFADGGGAADPARAGRRGGDRHVRRAAGGCSERRLPVWAEPPLRWISPNAVAVAADGPAPPPLGRFVLRSDEFRPRARLEVRQDGRPLGRSGPVRLIPGRPVHLGAGWLGRIDPSGGPVQVLAGTGQLSRCTVPAPDRS